MTPIQYANSQFSWKLRMFKVCNQRANYVEAAKAWIAGYFYMKAN